MLLPHAIKGHRTGQWLIFILGTLTVILGWFLYIWQHEKNNKWRELVAAIAALYLIGSVPVFFFEFSPFY
jgi:uncharacterized membrane protein